MKIVKKIFKWTTSGIGFTVASKLVEVIFNNGFNSILTMPLNLILKAVFGYWAVKVLLVLAGIFVFYIASSLLIKAICRWHQKAMDNSVEKAMNKRDKNNKK